MRRIINLIVPVFVILALSISCSDDDSVGQGQLKVLLTDAPADFTEVNVNITEVWAHYSGNANSEGGWIQLIANPGFYDLLQLQNGVTEVIADPTTLPAGKLTQMRLVLGENNHAVEIIDSVVVQHPLLLSSQDRTGIKINVDSDILNGQTLVLTLDFDAETSIIEQGNGEYRLKPVIKVDNVIYIP